MAFHFGYNCLVYSCLAVGPEVFPRLFAALSYDEPALAPYALARVAVSAACLAAAGAILVAIVRRRNAADAAADCRTDTAVVPVGLTRTDLVHHTPS
jgi:hypothetical protein